jgi:hypothetical protein
MSIIVIEITNLIILSRTKGNKMKISKILLLALLLFSAQKSFAGGSIDDSGEASGMIGAAGLSVVAAPVLASVGVVALAISAGEGMGELSGAVIDSAFSETCQTNCVIVSTGKGKKSIPFVVRKDYVQLNERI